MTEPGDVAPILIPPLAPEAPGLSPARAIGLRWLYTVTIFLAAALLFCVQPMVAKLILPLLGGSPAVWNTCLVFFQAALLAGYAYAHAATAWIGPRRHAVWHAAVLLAPLAVLPIGVGAEAARGVPASGNPSLWLLGFLTVLVGLPFFAVATTSPLLQTWFARTRHPDARDPYFLYAASNLGSMLALLGYPLLIEPNLRLATQTWAWSIGYAALAVLTLACAATVRSAGLSAPPVSPLADATPRPTARDWLIWIGLAALPSSLLMGVTTYLTTDVAAIPLLWVVPLALYLLSFIIVFSRRPILPHALVVRLAPIGVAMVVLLLCVKLTRIAWAPFHLIAFFLVAMLCHGELARRRPPARDLTAFYLALSLGGVLGGLFNALLAPLVFTTTLEYDLALAASALALPLAAGVAGRPAWRSRVLDLAVPAALGAALALTLKFLESRPDWNPEAWGLRAAFGVAALVAYATAGRPVRMALALLAMFAAGVVIDDGRSIYRSRDFFGILDVRSYGAGPYRQLMHGSTLHGVQDLSPSMRRQPLTYYFRSGPVGDLFAAFHAGTSPRSVAIVGLGTGTTAAYAEPDERWTYYEIDPAVVRVARDPNLFTYLSDARAADLEVVLGDARQRLREAPERGYGLMVFDAFSSDAIPVHLMTREALALYRSKLGPGGLIAFHISNRYLELTAPLARLASDAGLILRHRYDGDIDPEERADGKLSSSWVVLAARLEDLGPIADDPRWQPVPSGPETALWTDDYSDLIRYFHAR